MTRRFPDAFLTRPRLASGGRKRGDGAHAVVPPIGFAYSRNPVAVFAPDGYEPNYAYPLLVWFHDAGEDERVLHRLMPLVTDRNAVGLALRGERLRAGGGFHWATAGGEAREWTISSAIRNLRSEYHVHTERVILAGKGSGAAAAAELFLGRPEWFGGLALFDPPAETLALSLEPREDLGGKPVLLDLPVAELGRGREGASRLGAAGLDVTFRHTRAGGLCPEALRHLNRWLLAAVCGVNV